jgi:nitrite reductase (cytochrome c-552)
MGFHSPQESMRILMDAVNQAQQVRVEMARLLATKGITDPVQYPDLSTREKAAEVMRAFESGNPINLLPGT